MGLFGIFILLSTTVYWTMHDFAVCLHDLSRHFRANTNLRSQISAQHWVLIRVLDWLVPEHNPIIEPMLTELTGIRSSTQLHCLRDFSLKHIHIHGCMWPYVGLRIQCIIPYPLRCTNLDYLPTSALIQLPDSLLILKFPWGVCLHMLYVTIRLLELTPEWSKCLLPRSTHQNLGRHTICLE